MITLLVALVGGTLTSQLPEFAQQYRQRLGGAIDALHMVLSDFDYDAKQTGLNRAQALQRMAQSADPFVQERVKSIQRVQHRYETLLAQRSAMVDAGAFRRVMVFLQNPDSDLIEAAWQDYEPAVPTSYEGLVSAGMGVLASLLVLFGLRQVVGAPKLLGRAAKKQRASQS